MVLGQIFEQLLKLLKSCSKFTKNPILIEISSNFLHNIKTCICIRKNSLLVILTIRPTHGLGQIFEQAYKFIKKCNFDRNQLKLS